MSYRIQPFVVLAIACAATIAACGSSTAPDTASAAGVQALAYVRCLRSHGVPNFPDPGPDGRLPNVPSDIDTAAPAFGAAQRACAKLMPGGTGAGSSPGEMRLRLLAAARCLRSHGITSTPDPTTSPPATPAPGGHAGNAIGGPGGYLQLPPPSPASVSAEAACGLATP